MRYAQRLLPIPVLRSIVLSCIVVGGCADTEPSERDLGQPAASDAGAGTADGSAAACRADADCGGDRCVDGACEPRICRDGEERGCTTACGAGIQRCLGGAWAACPARSPRPEVCGDDRDDDCDGAVDEAADCAGCTDGMRRICENACGVGEETCDGGVWAGCTAPAGEEESCDNDVDEDCDGAADEGCDAPAGCEPGVERPCQGPCGEGTQACGEDGGDFGACVCPAPACDDAVERTLKVTDAPGSRSSRPRWASTGAGLGLAWSENADQMLPDVVSTMWFARIDPELGVVAGPRNVFDRVFADLVWTGDAFAAFGITRNRLYLRSINERGFPGASRTLVDEARVSLLDASWNGRALAVVYNDRETERVTWAAFARDGGVDRAAVRVSNETARAGSPAVGWSGEAHGVAWADGRFHPDAPADRTVFFRRVEREGRTGAERQIAEGEEPVLAWTGEAWAIVYVDFRDGKRRLYLSRVDAAGAPVGAERVLSEDAAGNVQGPAVVWSGAELGVAWKDTREGGAGVWFGRFDATGESLGPTVRVVGGDAQAGGPSIAWTGSRWAVAWSDRRHAPDDPNVSEIYAAFGRMRCD